MHYPGMSDRRHYRAAVIGAGFGGVAVGAALGQAGIDYVILECAASIGGTWRDNTYPGYRCDVPSHLYSLSFAPRARWRWSGCWPPGTWPVRSPTRICGSG